MKGNDLTPTRPFRIEKDKPLHQVLEDMRHISFQGRNLGRVLELWKRMLSEDIVIFMGLAGAMLAGGMREIVAYLIRERYIDCLVSTGANLFHDVYESMGTPHYIGDPDCDDVELHRRGLDRIYDTLASNDDFLKMDRYVLEFSKELKRKDPMTTREYFYRLGKRLRRDSTNGGILTAAYESNVPVYCPAIGDSSFGIALSVDDETRHFPFDTVGDVRETAQITNCAEKSGVVYIGGGTPKNFIQQTEVTAPLLGIAGSEGHHFAIQVITDAPYWGGLSGCTFEEAKSWGKISYEARKVTLHCDATIVLPLVVQALADSSGELAANRRKPDFMLSSESLEINRP
jgi:deoxyhypusine synthase